MLQHEKRRCLAAFGILGAGLLLLLLLNLRIGSVRVPMDQLWESCGEKIGTALPGRSSGLFGCPG